MSAAKGEGGWANAEKGGRGEGSKILTNVNGFDGNSQANSLKFHTFLGI